jgi:hypothetical protein
MPVTSHSIIHIDKPADWPDDLTGYLERNYEFYLGWQTERTTVFGWQIDQFVYGLQNVLRPYSMVGWHCSRLTDEEISVIERTGMQMPDQAMLFKRVDAAVVAGRLDERLGTLLKARNQAHEEYRAGRLYFCFFPPKVAGEGGISRFFRYWGGEALYNSHEDDSITGCAIAKIGTPCIVEATVPIASIRAHSFLSDKFARSYAVSQGHQTTEPIEHEDAIVHPLPAANIKRVILFPAPEFVELTACDRWDRPIPLTGR